MNKTNVIIAVGVMAIVGLLSFFIVFNLVSRQNTVKTSTDAPTPPAPTPTIQSSPAAQGKDGSILTDIFGTSEPAATNSNESWIQTAGRIILRFLLAVVLSGLLAFRPRKNVPLLQRNLYVAQTQILLAVVAAALMMVVGDNAARAFAIFAAVSLVRFRTNIRDPKEITVLLVSLAIGLAMGVGRWELAVILCLFVLPLLWILEYNEPEQIFRAMRLTVKTKDTERTQDVMKQIFARNKLEAEVRQLDPPDETNPIGCIMYYLNLRLNVSTDQLNDQVLAIDPSIEGISWEQQKSVAYAYQ